MSNCIFADIVTAEQDRAEAAAAAATDHTPTTSTTPTTTTPTTTTTTTPTTPTTNKRAATFGEEDTGEMLGGVFDFKFILGLYLYVCHVVHNT